MYHITRQTFPDRLLTTAELSPAADLWRQWYTLTGPMGERGSVLLSARVYGFPRADAASLQAQLPGSTLTNPDTLEVRGPETPADAAVNTSAWDRTLAATAGRPLVVSLYVAVVGSARFAPNEPGSANALLLVGRSHADGLLLKAVMRLGSTGKDEEMFRKAAWPREGKFLTALNHFRVSGDARGALAFLGPDAKNLFVTRDTERKMRRIAGLLFELPGEHSPLAFAQRMILPLGMAGSARMLMVHKPDAWPMAAGGFGLAALMAGRAFYTKAMRINRYHKAMNAGLAKVYAKPPTFAKTDLPAAGLTDDPNAVKFTADILALGAVHCYDFQITSLETTHGTIRLFHLPAERTLVTLTLMPRTHNVHLFPAKAIVQAKTYFDGDAIVSTLAAKQGYRKPVNPNSRNRCVPEDTDPATLLARHREHVRQAAPAGRQPLAVDPEDVFARETAEHLRLQDRHRARGCFYTWSDALHEGFAVPRRELTR